MRLPTNTGAYTRYVYGPDYVQSFGSVNNIADESYSIGYFDGAGRVFATAGNHPGSTGGYKAQLTYYDVMGRTMKQSNPIEIYGSWAPAGDDAAGWIFTQQTYDWKGRPLVTTNTDGTQKYAGYSACGCAGSEVATLTDELGRQQKVYKDVLGRVTKTEALNWDSSVYATTANSYNARDQVTLVRQYQGTDTSGVYQDTTMSYDGYGRLLTKHVPEQDSGTATSYSYNSDDTVQSITDARQASANYSYNNNRHLVTGITYTASGGITIPVALSFGYDAVGNRTSMTDGTGSTSYNYDQLSRMTSETHNITGLGANTIGYQYNLANQLTSVTNPLNATINYAHDQAGRLSAVTGSSFGGVTNYASNMEYRAWGAVKHTDFGDGKTVDATYTARLQAATFQIPGLISKTYDYYADNRLRFSSDLVNHKFDRFYSYDHANRLKEALSGAEARFEPPTNDRPYRQTYDYDAMGHLTQRTFKRWDLNMSSSDSYTNNRHHPVGELWQYDADGNLTTGAYVAYAYDAAGRADTVWAGNSSTVLGLDGDGRQVKSAETVYDPQTQTDITTTRYYVRSSVLGGEALTELEPANSYSRSFVYAGSAVLATQESYGGPGFVWWEHRDPSNASYRTSAVGNPVGDQAELDPVGANAGITDGSTQSIPDQGSLAPYPSFGSGANIGTTYSMDGIRMPVDEFMQIVNQLFHGGLGVGLALAQGNRVIGTRKVYQPGDSDRIGPYQTVDMFGTNPMAMDLLFAEPQKTDPRKAQQVLIPLQSVSELKKLMQDRLDYENCLEAVNKLIAQLGTNALNSKLPDNQPNFDGVMSVFEKIAGQGGIRVNVWPTKYPPGPRSSGGSGYAWRENHVWRNGEYLGSDMKVWIYIKGAFTDSPDKAFDFIVYEYGITGIHEMLHEIGKWEHSEADLNKAATQLGGRGIDDYLRNHCNPPGYRTK